MVLRFGLLLWIISHLPDTKSVDLPDAVDIFNRFPEALRVTTKEVMKSALLYRQRDLVDLKLIVLDKRRQQLIVGARNMVVRLKAQNLAEMEILKWPASSKAVEMCRIKGQNEDTCNNFVRLIAERNNELLICGTHAFAPICTKRKADNLHKEVGQTTSGIGKTAYSPQYKSAYVMTKAGELYTGVTTDFSSQDPALLRILPGDKFLRTTKSNNRWLNDPVFVAAFEVENFVYFFFTEIAVELSGCGSKRVSRVGRVCKNDVGGDIVLVDSWTTFNKAKLNCTVRGVHYDKLRAAHYDHDQHLFHAVFTTAAEEIPASAVCTYRLSDVRAAFAGKYLYQRNSQSPWIQHPNSYPFFDCQVEEIGRRSHIPGITTRSLVEAQNYQLMAPHVQPTFQPVPDVAKLERYINIVVDKVRVKHYGTIPVIFILTESGVLKKYSLLPDKTVKSNGYSEEANYSQSCLVEVLQTFRPDSVPTVTDMKLYSEMSSLYIATKDSLVKLPLERCWRHSTRQQCLDAEDPYCGWDTRKRSCSPAPGGITSHHYWHQNLDGCPKTHLPVDGGFGDWSEWFSCPQKSKQGENCKCRNRGCDNPKPRHGGSECQGPTVQVSNCTSHGNWTVWSEWSACSASCGLSLRSRSRYCSNPSPAHGGRQCLGPDSQQEYCKQTACPIPVEPPVHGGWSEWTSWDSCSRKCGAGIQRRSRSCNNPAPANNGTHCSGCDMEYRVCHTEACEEVRRWSEWTGWLQTNGSSTAKGVWVKRFKFACSARIDDPKMLSVSVPRTEERFCHKHSHDCTDTGFVTLDGGWSSWLAWSECSKPCGNGSQHRVRACSSPVPSGSGADCPGHGKERRQCNAHSCEATWTCWNAYSDCSVTCGVGVKHRVRECEHVAGMKFCEGERVQTLSCEMGSCTEDGFGPWSSWSKCSELNVKVRLRPCISKSYCEGIPDAQMMKCITEAGEANALEVKSAATSGRLVLIFGLVGAFVGGVILTLLLTCYALRNRSNCCYFMSKKKPKPKTVLATSPKLPMATSNIYTPPPIRNNVHPTQPNITLNPLLDAERRYEMVDMDAFGDQEAASLTLKRPMRASLDTRDYL